MTRILVFDSGVGGLSVATEIRALMPDVELRYLADNGFFPYGTKPEDDLLDRIDRVVGCGVASFAPDCVVVACNTASTIALPRLRSRLSCPVVGVVPAIKPAAALSRNRILGLLGTPGTVKRAYPDELIRQFAADCVVIRVGAGQLVELAERAFAGDPVSIPAITSAMAPLFDRPASLQPDTVVLACTHFPLLRDALIAAAPSGTRFVDSGRAVAERVRTVLGDRRVSGSTDQHVWFTRDDPAIRRSLPGFAARGFANIAFLAVG
jgi:glutamate racemase